MIFGEHGSLPPQIGELAVIMLEKARIDSRHALISTQFMMSRSVIVMR
jgi:hypothetical protein